MNRRLRLAAGLAAAFATPALPAWAVATALHPRWRRDWAERWGLSGVPIGPGGVWVHAASVGEVRVAEALLAGLPRPVLLTADTDTGAARARDVAADHDGVVAAVRPVDHPWTLAPLWAEARPRAVVLVENAWWPQLVARAVGEGIPVVRAGARPGAGSRRAAVVWSAIGSGVVVTAAVDPAGARFHARWSAAAPTGDCKRDAPTRTPPLAWPGPFVVAASTRPGDEQAILDAWATLKPRPRLLLAPRHLERVAEVEAIVAGRGLVLVRRTTLRGKVPERADVVLLDTLGELAGMYAGARAAFVGGTLDPRIGGHSPAEALAAGVPVVAGPHVHAWPAFSMAGVTVAPRDALARALRAAIDGPRPDPGPTGAAEATLAHLEPWLGGPAAPEAAPRPWARPLVAAWAVGSAARALLGAVRTPDRLPVPVWSVGSPSARGPGRTSTVRWLADALATRGHRVGIAVRGYGRTTRGADPRRSWHTRDVSDLGDEGALCARDGHLVAAGDRVRAAWALVEAGATAIVLDDALQDRRLHRDVDLVVIDARRPRASGLLPAGDRRSVRVLPPADGVIVHHADDPVAQPIPGGVVAHRLIGPWHRGDEPCDPPARVAAVLGVARPADALASLGVPVARWRVLPDHAPVDDALAADLAAWAGDLPLACTAKDAVRLPPALREGAFWRDLRVRIDDPPAAWFAPARSGSVDAHRL